MIVYIVTGLDSENYRKNIGVFKYEIDAFNFKLTCEFEYGIVLIEEWLV
jgi:hypothetical protein